MISSPTPSRAMITDDSGETAAAEGLEGAGPDLAPLLLDQAPRELAYAALEALEDHLRRLDEELAAVLLADAEAVELDPPEPPADAEHDAAVRQVVEHRHLLRNAHRVVPRQHHDHRAELDALRARGVPGQELEHVGAHRVLGEVVLDAPERLEAERFGEIAEAELVAVDVAIGAPVAHALEDHGHPDVHRPSSRFDPRSIRARGRRCPRRLRGRREEPALVEELREEP